jgi:hypothetical protein
MSDVEEAKSRLRTDIKNCRAAKDVVHFYGVDKDGLARDIELIMNSQRFAKRATIDMVRAKIELLPHTSNRDNMERRIFVDLKEVNKLLDEMEGDDESKEPA